jgi:hypothetical protein
VPLGVLAAFLRPLRVSGDHRGAQSGAEHPGGLPPAFGSTRASTAAGGLLGQHPGRLGDQPGAVHVDHPGG